MLSVRELWLINQVIPEVQACCAMGITFNLNNWLNDAVADNGMTVHDLLEHQAKELNLHRIDAPKKVVDIFPANNFSVVCDNAAKDIECGLIIGYDCEGRMSIFGGGLLDGRQPVSKDWLWMVQSFTQKLLNGDYAE